ncbi:MAG: hypothetical protein WBG38_12095 [Nodosilinea sp.]
MSASQAIPTSLELDILAQLLISNGTCPTLTALPVVVKSSLKKRIQACQALQARGWLDYNTEVAQFGLTLVGKTLMGLDLAVWPVTPDERLILRSCLKGRIDPGQIHYRVSTSDRQKLLRGLAEQGLIVVYREAIVNLRLTSLDHACLIQQDQHQNRSARHQ